MVSKGIGKALDEVREEPESGVSANGCSKTKDLRHLRISTSQTGLIGQENHQKGFIGSLTAFSNRVAFLKSDSSRPNLSSPSAKFQRFADERDEFSRSVPSSSHSFSERIKPFLRDMNWDSLVKLGKVWIRDPMNMALLVWIICVAVSGAILFMVMIGMLNHAIPKKSQRNVWFEINNQILNALFTLMCLYQHPKRIYHFVLLCRWRPEDISKLRKIYCKNGTYKPHEWAHMMVAVALLNLNCFAQYALCGLNLGYKRSKRPPVGVGITIAVAIGAAAGAGLYTILSPLGRDYESEMDPEAQNQIAVIDVNRSSYTRRKSLQKRFSFALRENEMLIENKPKWKGGLFDIWDDISAAYLSLFCSFCIFGWNMERIGFGNMYVHIATFLLFCTAPFWIFNLAASNVENDTVREAMGIAGVVLCIFGLLYGGFWRIQMRKRFKLPANDFCCGKPAVADCTQWLFCCWCSLAQEVRTVNFYEIVEDKLCKKEANESEQPLASPLPREDVSVQSRLNQSSPSWDSYSPSKSGMVSTLSPSRRSNDFNSPDRHLPVVKEESSVKDEGGIMMHPVPPLIQREDDRTSSS